MRNTCHRTSLAIVDETMPSQDIVVKTATPASVLQELFELLEDYGPAWYTEEQHSRILSAMRTLQ